VADPTRVDIPGVGMVEFPDSMTPDAVNEAAKRLHDDANPSATGWRRAVDAGINNLTTLPRMALSAIQDPKAAGTALIEGLAPKPVNMDPHSGFGSLGDWMAGKGDPMGALGDTAGSALQMAAIGGLSKIGAPKPPLMPRTPPTGAIPSGLPPSTPPAVGGLSRVGASTPPLLPRTGPTGAIPEGLPPVTPPSEGLLSRIGEQPRVDLTQPVQAGSLTQQQIGERIAAMNQARAAGEIPPRSSLPVQKPMIQRPAAPEPVAPEPPMSATIPPRTPPVPAGRIANEEAIARRQAAYQASLKPIAEDPAAALAQRLGTPSDADVSATFGPRKSTSLTRPAPKADMKARLNPEKGSIAMSALLKSVGVPARAVAYPMAHHYGGNLGVGALAAADIAKLIAENPKLASQLFRGELLSNMAVGRTDKK